MAAAFSGVVEKMQRNGSDEEVDSDAEEQHDTWIPDTTVPKDINKKQKCKGCNETFSFIVSAGTKLCDSSSVQSFYKHCLDNCVQYPELGLVRTCDDCRSCFLNEEQLQRHHPKCMEIAAAKVKKRRALESASQPPQSPPARRRRNNSVSSNSSNADSNNPDGEDDGDDVSDDEMLRLADSVNAAAENLLKARMRAVNEKQAMKLESKSPATAVPIAAVSSPAVKRRAGPASRTMQHEVRPESSSSMQSTPSVSSVSKAGSTKLTPTNVLANGRPRPGPKSRTKPDGYDKEPKNVGPFQRAPVVPTPESVHRVEAGRRLTGKDISQLMAFRSAGAARKQRATPSNPNPKRKASKSSAKKRKRTSSSAHSDSGEDSEEYPEYILTLKDVVLQKDEYMIHIPTKAKNLRYMNSSIFCPECNESFPACIDNDRLSIVPIPSPSYYEHCLSKCQPFMRKRMKDCSSCCHRFLDDEALRMHKKNNYCSKWTKKIKLLKLKMPWMQRQLFFDLLDFTMNSKMCCPGCSEIFECNKKQEVYTPGLQLQCHMLSDCESYIASGKMIQCTTCAKPPVEAYYYINEEWYKRYDPCHDPPQEEDYDEMDRNDPNSPYYGKGKGRGKEGLSL